MALRRKFQMESLLEKIRYNTGHFPKNELEEIIENKEAYIPELLRIVQDVRDNYKGYIDRQDDLSHIYAFFLLAQFRVKELFPIFIDILKIPDGDDLDLLLGDFLTEGGGRVLATLSENEEDIIQLKELIENEEIDEFVQGQSLRALVGLVSTNKLQRDEVLGYFEQLLKRKMDNPETKTPIITNIICYSNDLYPDQLYDLIKKAFDANLVDNWMINLNDIERTLARNKEEVLADSYRENRLIEDTIDELQNWACFYKDRPKRKKVHKSNLKSHSSKVHSPNKPIVNKINIGRNDPCLCGSGKKYKKCCGG